MIIYNTKHWGSTLLKIALSIVYARNYRLMLWGVLGVGSYACLLTFLSMNVWETQYHLDPLFFTVVGLILSLILVFRLNTSYNKWWEGRMLWGGLINVSRSFAIHINSLLSDDEKEREWFACMISNFGIALRGHLRGTEVHDEIFCQQQDQLAALSHAKHAPNAVLAAIDQRVQALAKADKISGYDKLVIKEYLSRMTDTLGGCERIMNTPIPFSHSSFIKFFVIIYLLTLPFGLINKFLYMTIPTCMLMAYALIGVEIISEEIEDPFGYDANDLPLTRLTIKIQTDVHHLLGITVAKPIAPAERNSHKLFEVVH